MFDGKFSFFCFLEKNQNKACLSNFKSAMETKLVLLFRPIYIIQNSNTKIIYWLKRKRRRQSEFLKKKREAIFTNWRNEHRMPLNETNFASLICCKKQWDCPSWAGRCLLNCYSFYNDPELLQNISAKIAKTESVKALTTTWTAEDSGFGRSLVMTAGGVDVISIGGKTTCMACSV